mmetsp:Transcript_12668/g.19094  ORF Transcript_12668/g.19094 Transcript_12668/m.19094 type:complete len:423 (+) Transcript_12668:67-1335(+)
MPKEKQQKKSVQLRHTPLGMETDTTDRKKKHTHKAMPAHNDDDEAIPDTLGTQIYNQAREQRMEMSMGEAERLPTRLQPQDSDSEYDDDVEEDEEGEDMVEYDGEYVDVNDLTEAEEAIVHRFLDSDKQDSRTLADIIMNKIREKESGEDLQEEEMAQAPIPPKVMEVYTMVGKMLHTYKSGKLPKALKMLPHLKNWEEVLWITRPDQWSACATFACTRIFASNLNEKMAQRFFSVVLLEKCRDDIRANNKLNYHLYMALKKALFKPGAFYKGILIPLASSRTCTLREATIIGSVLAKVSVPGNHSAAALLRLADMTYSGSTSLFIKVLINKKYALPRRVIDALVNHFCAFTQETRVLPVLWHQALLAFAQRYKFELDESQRAKLKALLRAQQHHQITTEIRRELFTVTNHHDNDTTDMSVA